MRTAFTTLGRSELSDRITFHLQKQYRFIKHQEIVHDEAPKLVIVDAFSIPVEFLQNFVQHHKDNNVYYFVVSDDLVYKDLDANLEPRPVSSMSEDWPTVIPSALDPGTLDILKVLFVESLLLQTNKPCTIVRPFGIYGADLPNCVVMSVLRNVQAGTVTLLGAGDIVRTFLPLSDFLFVVEKLAQRLLKGQEGIYNVGSTECITTKHLVETLWGFVHGPNVPVNVFYEKPDKYLDQWKIPDTTRVSAVLRWSPKNSLRKGLWELVESSK